MIPSFPCSGRQFRNVIIIAISAASLVFVCRACALPRYVVRCADSVAARSLAVARSQVGVKEATGHNDGAQVEMYLHSVGLGRGYAWCAAFQYWTFEQTGGAAPFVRTPLANGIFADAVRRGTRQGTYRAGDLLVWRHGGAGSSGHVGRIVAVLHDGYVRTVEGNTSSGTGNQRDGDGVYERVRNVRLPLGQLYLRGFVGFRQ